MFWCDLLFSDRVWSPKTSWILSLYASVHDGLIFPGPAWQPRQAKFWKHLLVVLLANTPGKAVAFQDSTILETMLSFAGYRCHSNTQEGLCIRNRWCATCCVVRQMSQGLYFPSWTHFTCNINNAFWEIPRRQGLKILKEQFIVSWFCLSKNANESFFWVLKGEPKIGTQRWGKLGIL